MKLKVENILVGRGGFYHSEKYNELYQNITDGILSVTWAAQHEFVLNPILKGNGVLPIKNNFIAHLVRNGWQAENTMSLISGVNPGPIDATYKCAEGLVGVEWETGNISSSQSNE